MIGDDEDDAWYLTGETTDGQPLRPFVVIDVEGPGPVRSQPLPEDASIAYVTCGAVQAGAMLVLCECGCVRQVDRPHDYVADVQLRGWICYCGIFNGEEKERLITCRTCGAQRPI